MVEPGGVIRPEGDGRPQKELLQGFERPPVDEFLPPAGEGILVGFEVEADAGDVITRDFDFARITTPQPRLMGKPDERQRKRVKSHHLRGDGVNCHLVAARQQIARCVDSHTAGPGAVSGEGSICYREHARVNLLLDGQQIHQGLVDHRMGPVAPLVKQSAEGVLHRSRNSGEDMGLHGGQMEHAAAKEAFRNLDTVRIDLRQGEHLSLRLVGCPLLTFFVKVDILYVVFLQHGTVLVFDFAPFGGDHDSAIMAAVDEFRGITVLQQGAGDPFQLPGSG